ncbi:hypothetical protein ACFPRA_01370 [Sporosarcina soli]|uniref:Uncharacterized protein n=1 Tax=Sporosarcina soli TaxID=334736 RepID=A0ABW0TEI8_9BACL
MDYKVYFKTLGYRVESNEKGLKVKQGDKEVLLSNQMMQQTNKQYLTIMVKEAMR